MKLMERLWTKNRSFILLMAEILHQLRLVVFPIIYRVSYIPGGAGFQPSTVGLSTWRLFFLSSLCFWNLTLPETNSKLAPGNGPSPKGISSSNHWFSRGKLLVSGRVNKNDNTLTTWPHRTAFSDHTSWRTWIFFWLSGMWKLRLLFQGGHRKTSYE